MQLNIIQFNLNEHMYKYTKYTKNILKILKIENKLISAFNTDQSLPFNFSCSAISGLM